MIFIIHKIKKKIKNNIDFEFSDTAYTIPCLNGNNIKGVEYIFKLRKNALRKNLKMVKYTNINEC